MPAKNATKQYIAESYYHLYNRGVEKRKIFLDEQDYAVFLSYLKEYLLPKDEKALKERLLSDISYKEKDSILKKLRLKNFATEISLIAYCLMPNHFHMLVKQESAGAIDAFMSSLSTRFSMYFNRKYDRVGPLYQGVYKAVLVETDEQLLHLTRYIHKQALASRGETLQEKQPCSYSEYLGKRKTEWVKPSDVLEFFSKRTGGTYDEFLRGEESHELIHGLTIDQIESN